MRGSPRCCWNWTAARISRPEEDALAEVLTLLIEDYEEKYHPLPRVSPNESLHALMEERGLKHKDIWPVLCNKGSRHRGVERTPVYE